MMKRRKKAVLTVCMVLAAVIAGIFTGCTSSAPGGGDSEISWEIRTGDRINAPSGVKYFTKNNLTVETIEVNRDGSLRDPKMPSPYEYDQMIRTEKEKWRVEDIYFSGSYVQISGLKDEETEKIVNEKLKNLCLDNLERVPPYRGIKAEIGDTPVARTDVYSSTHESVYFNDNNILSVGLFVSNQFDSSVNSWGIVDVYYMETLNIDLNTGNEIMLADLFCNDIDAADFLDTAVSEAILDGNGDEEGWFYGEHIKINRPFKGLSPNQKYLIGDTGVQLLFDYETPEFDVDYGYLSLIVPFSDEFAITERFFSEDEIIYTDEKPQSKRFAYDVEREYWLDEYSGLDDHDWFTISKRAAGSPKTPEAVKKKMLAFLEEKEKEIKKEIADAVPAEDLQRYEAGEGMLTGDGYLSADSRSVGPYLTVTYTEYVNVWTPDYGNEANENVLNKENTFTETYDLRTNGEEPIKLTLENIFVPGADYEGIIKQAMIDSINGATRETNEIDQNGNSGTAAFSDYDTAAKSSDETEKRNKEYIDKLYENIVYFSIENDNLQLMIENAEEIYQEVYGKNPYDIEGGYAYINYAQNLNYSYMDCSQLTIFDF